MRSRDCIHSWKRSGRSNEVLIGDEELECHMAHLTKQAGCHVLHSLGSALETAPAQLHGAECKLGSRPKEEQVAGLMKI